MDNNTVATPTLRGMVDMTNDEYHSGPGISKSHLDWIAPECGKTPKHYWHRYLNPEREPETTTPAKLLGSACHTAILEPDLLASHVVPGLDIDRRSNANKAEWAAYEAQHAGKIILPADAYQTMLRVRDAVHAHPVAGPLLRDIKAEQSFFTTDPETGELIKCRFDGLQTDGYYSLDLKSTDSASPDAFGRSSANYRYFLQPPWYHDILFDLYGERPQDWFFVAFEKEPPYCVSVFYAPLDQQALGRKLARRDLNRIVACKQANDFPDYGVEARPLELPGWFTRGLEGIEA